MRASQDLLDELHKRKERGESYEDVVWRLLEEHDGERQQQPREPAPVEDTSTEEELNLDGVTIDVPGSGELEDRRKETIIEMAELLRDRGTAEKSDFIEVVDPERVDYASSESFWSNAVKGQESLRAIPRVQKPSDGRTEWKWSG